ncbi:MAG: site-specific DNA-methyltransferase [Symbiobacteriaceae bacterium]|nr:site-specific DNA-methyltransferase [Symbiobacteriaceae bacterium]
MELVGYRSGLGTCLQGDSFDLLGRVEDESIQLIVTSPPFALQRPKEYGNETQHDYVEWLAEFGYLAYKKLRLDGSLVIDLGGAYEKGIPSYSLYQFRVLLKFCDDIGFRLAQPFYWHNPSALPAPIEWVNKRKLRAKNSVNTIWWFCKDPLTCKANVAHVLTPYSNRMKQLLDKPEDFIRQEGTARPSGHVLGLASWTNDNGGAIPPNMLQIPNSESNSHYLRYCKEMNLKGHPARFPSGIPDFFIRFLTDEGDMVVDIFSGSNTTGSVAERLNRHWSSFDISLEYVANSILRFVDDLDEAREAHRTILSGGFVNLSSSLQVPLSASV